jgi:hypothetical protein
MRKKLFNCCNVGQVARDLRQSCRRGAMRILVLCLAPHAREANRAATRRLA